MGGVSNSTPSDTQGARVAGIDPADRAVNATSEFALTERAGGRSWLTPPRLIIATVAVGVVLAAGAWFATRPTPTRSRIDNGNTAMHAAKKASQGIL